MRGIKLTIVLKQKFPVGTMASFASPAGAHAYIVALINVIYFEFDNRLVYSNIEGNQRQNQELFSGEEEHLKQI
jgi:hypothetical protein